MPRLANGTVRGMKFARRGSRATILISSRPAHAGPWSSAPSARGSTPRSLPRSGSKKRCATLPTSSGLVGKPGSTRRAKTATSALQGKSTGSCMWTRGGWKSPAARRPFWRRATTWKPARRSRWRIASVCWIGSCGLFRKTRGILRNGKPGRCGRFNPFMAMSCKATIC